MYGIAYNSKAAGTSAGKICCTGRQTMEGTTFYIDGKPYPLTEGKPLKGYLSDAAGVLCAQANGYVCDLDMLPRKGEEIRLLTLSDKDGFLCYRQTLFLILAQAVYDVFGANVVHISRSINKATYVRLSGLCAAQDDAAARILARMRELVRLDLPIEKRTVSPQEAYDLFMQERDSVSADAVKGLARRQLHLYQIDKKLFHMTAVLAVRTGVIQTFSFRKYKDGFLLEYPNDTTGGKLPPFSGDVQLFNLVEQSSIWADVLSIRQVSDLNQIIRHESSFDMILMQEGLHEKQIAKIADAIKMGMPAKKVVLISGPSSSGKTTFAHKLGIQLRVNGITPIRISLDDYFVDLEHALRHEDGTFNFEELESIDYQLFNEHMHALIRGEEVGIPIFSFTKSRRLDTVRRLRLREGQVLIVEGIHALNDKLTAAVDAKHKFKLYCSPITELSFDALNPISPTNIRLLRRLVRDYNFRSSSAQNTFELWPSVQKGEVKNIFPYEQQADMIFNSSIIYELCVFRRYAEPILRDVQRSSPYYAQAQSLLRILSYCEVMDDYKIPSTSLIREFIGGSIFS